jgi:hypothetical protein
VLLDLAEKVGVRGLVLSAIVVLPPSVLGLEIFVGIYESWGTIMEQLRRGNEAMEPSFPAVLYSSHKYN